jgi:hypothetical protein
MSLFYERLEFRRSIAQRMPKGLPFAGRRKQMNRARKLWC